MDTTFIYLKKSLVLMVFVMFGLFATYIPQPYNQHQNVPEAEALFGGIVLDVTNLVQNTVTAIASLGLQVKEYVLDAIGWALSKSIVAGMVADTIKWVNKGIDNPLGGKDPVFVQQLDKFLRDKADEQASAYVDKLGEDDWSYLCSPFKLDIQTALAQEYTQVVREGKPPGQAPANPSSGSAQSCDLEKVENLEDFIGGDFSAGGWDDWFEVVGSPSKYTPYGQYATARRGMLNQIKAGQEQEQRVLDWGNGFQSIEKCDPVDSGSPSGSAAAAGASTGSAGPSSAPNSALAGELAYTDPGLQRPSQQALTLDANLIGTGAPTSNILQQYEAENAANNSSANNGSGSAAGGSGTASSPSSGSLGGSLAAGAASGGKTKCKIVTPGPVILDDLNKKLGTGVESLLKADELNEFIGSLLGQLATKAVTGAAGLLGLSEGDSNSYLSQMTAEAQTQADGAAAQVGTSIANSSKQREMEVTKQTQNSMSIAATQYEDYFRNALINTTDDTKRARIGSYIQEVDRVGITAAGHERQIQTEYLEVFQRLELEFNSAQTTDERKVEIRAEQEAKYKEFQVNRGSYYTDGQVEANVTRWQTYLESL